MRCCYGARMTGALGLGLNDEAFRAKIGRDEVARVQRDAAEGRFGPGQDAAVEEHGTPQRVGITCGVIVGGLFALTTLVIAFAQPEILGASVVMTVVVAVLATGGGYLLTRRGRARQWERHARMAQFARANGMSLRLVASEEEVPAVILPVTEQPAPVVHIDLATRWDGARQIAVGTRVRQVEETRSTENGSGTVNVPRYLTWVALQPESEISPRQEKAIRRRLHQLGDDELMTSSTWAVVGVESKKDTLEKLPEVLEHVDQILEVLAVRDVRDEPTDAPTDLT